MFSRTLALVKFITLTFITICDIKCFARVKSEFTNATGSPPKQSNYYAVLEMHLRAPACVPHEYNAKLVSIHVRPSCLIRPFRLFAEPEPYSVFECSIVEPNPSRINDVICSTLIFD